MTTWPRFDMTTVVGRSSCVRLRAGSGDGGRRAMRKRVWLGACGLVLGTAMSGSAQAPALATGSGKTTYLVVYRPGPSWLPGKPVTEQPLKEHGRYMIELYTKG